MRLKQENGSFQRQSGSGSIQENLPAKEIKNNIYRLSYPGYIQA
jgi:hypothetical protein